MRVCVLSSGSKGNCTFIEIKNKNILIDIGNSCLYVEKSLTSIGINPSKIDAILITHSHVDHTNGLKVFAKKYNPQIYINETTYQELKQPLDNVKFIEGKIDLDDITIEAFNISHDVKANGYIIESDNNSVVYVTDTGYIKERTLKKIQNKQVYIFESNHDIEKLMNNDHYPHHTKIRILGDNGHLSNKDSAYYLSNIIGNKTKKIFLAHLSQDNNTQELALEALTNELARKNIQFNNITIAMQNEKTELIEV